jgi:PAS domain S-box-containing protein
MAFEGAFEALDDDARIVLDPSALRCEFVNAAAADLSGLRAGAPLMSAQDTLWHELARSTGDFNELRRVQHARTGAMLWMDVRALPVQTDGRTLIAARLRDVSAREGALRELELLRAVLDLSDDVLAIVERDTMRTLWVNRVASDWVGMTREDYIRLDPWVPVVGATRETYERDYDELIAISPTPKVVIRERLRADGSRFMAEHVRAAINVDGRWIIAISVRDITSRLEAEQRMEELARSNSDLEQFAYMVSHDLSEPLRMVGSYAQLLARRYTERLDDDGREFVGFIVDGAHRMKRLIDDLLTYSRAGRGDAMMKQVPLDNALDEALLNMSRAIDEAGAVVEREPLPSVACQRVAMVQLFQNLVGNALKFRSETKPVIRINVQDDGDAWRFAVVDNGIGIAPEHFERIFVVFQRLHARERYEGTGIGLAIAKKIVERHGGRIWVESQPGAGTTFFFTLPKAGSDAAD